MLRFRFNGWIRGSTGVKNAWSMLVRSAFEGNNPNSVDLVANPSFEDTETVCRKFKAGERVIVLERKLLGEVIRARIAEDTDTQGKLVCSVSTTLRKSRC